MDFKDRPTNTKKVEELKEYLNSMSSNRTVKPMHNLDTRYKQTIEGKKNR